MSRKPGQLFQIVWSHDHASGVLPILYPSRDEAEEAAREWVQPMVEVDDPDDAAEDYDWEVLPYEPDNDSPRGTRPAT